MLLNAQQILAAEDRRTVEVDVPEWGPDAKVLVGSIGAMAHARLMDYVDGHGRVPSPPDTETSDADEALVSCDSPPPGPDAAAPIAPHLEKQYTRSEDMEVTLLWCIECVLDPETLRPAFGRDDFERLGVKSPAPLLRICNAAMELSHATDSSAQAFEKNSAGTSGPASGGA